MFSLSYKVEEVSGTKNILKNSNSPDIYGLTSVMLKNIANGITPILSIVFNLCLIEDIFPDAFKLAKVRVIPIKKKEIRHLLTTS